MIIEATNFFNFPYLLASSAVSSSRSWREKHGKTQRVHQAPQAVDLNYITFCCPWYWRDVLINIASTNHIVQQQHPRWGPGIIKTSWKWECVNLHEFATKQQEFMRHGSKLHCNWCVWAVALSIEQSWSCFGLTGQGGFQIWQDRSCCNHLGV